MVEPEYETPADRLTEEQCAWLAGLYESNYGSVFRACRNLLRDPEEAADAAHEVFLRALRHPVPIPPPTTRRDSGAPGGCPSLRPWLLTIARNHCIDILRRRTRMYRVVDSLSNTIVPEPDPATPVENRQVVAAIVGQLGQRERKALWQSAVERQPLAAIANELQLSYMAAAQLVSRARRRAATAATRLAGALALVCGSRALRRVRAPLNAHTVAGVVAIPVIAVALVPAINSAASAHQGAAHPAAILRGSAVRPSLAASAVNVSLAQTAGATGASRASEPISGPGVTSPLGSLMTSFPSAIISRLGSIQRAALQATSQAPALPAPGLSPLPLPLPSGLAPSH